jgi:hypothetical protein
LSLHEFFNHSIVDDHWSLFNGANGITVDRVVLKRYLPTIHSVSLLIGARLRIGLSSPTLYFRVMLHVDRMYNIFPQFTITKHRFHWIVLRLLRYKATDVRYSTILVSKSSVYDGAHDTEYFLHSVNTIVLWLGNLWHLMTHVLDLAQVNLLSKFGHDYILLLNLHLHFKLHLPVLLCMLPEKLFELENYVLILHVLHALFLQLSLKLFRFSFQFF